MVEPKFTTARLVNGQLIDYAAGDLLPEHIRDGVQRYFEDGIPPGGFLSAVICNDLFGALGRADDINRRKLFDICCWFYNHAPRGSYGSEENMGAWMERRRQQRATADKAGSEAND